MLGVIPNQAVCLKSREGDEQAQPLWECSGQWGRNHRDHISRRWFVRYYPAISFTGEITPLFPKPLYATQVTSVTWTCTEVQKLFLPAPSHPALSGHINLVTSGTKKMQLAKGYISLSQAQGSERIFRMEEWKEEGCLHIVPGKPGLLVPGSPPNPPPSPSQKQRLRYPRWVFARLMVLSVCILFFFFLLLTTFIFFFCIFFKFYFIFKL